MGRRFVIADTHFGDSLANIKINNRPFKNIKEHDKTLINNWNREVKPNDTVFVLGDFVINEDFDDGVSYIDLLNGKIVLIKGNHDDDFCKFYCDPTLKQLSFPTSKLEIINYPIILDDFYILSHYPMFTTELMPYTNIFGHIHGDTKYKDVDCRGMCVSAERINYTPIDFNVVKARIKGYKSN